MSPKPLSMKTLSRLSQKPMVRAERPIKASTIDLMHAKELERRSTIQRTSNTKPKP